MAEMVEQSVIGRLKKIRDILESCQHGWTTMRIWVDAEDIKAMDEAIDVLEDCTDDGK